MRFDRLKIFVLILLTIVVAIALSWAIDSKFDLPGISYQTFTNTISIISAVILLAIALVLYRKFGGDQYITDKHTEAVIDLLVKIAHLSFNLELRKSGGIRAGGLLNIDIFTYENHIENFLPELNKDHRDFLKQQIATEEVSKTLFGVWILNTNTYLPKEIATKLDNSRYLNAFGMSTEEIEGDYSILSNMHLGTAAGITFIRGKGQEADTMNLEGVISDLSAIYKEAQKWLATNNAHAYKSLNTKRL